MTTRLPRALLNAAVLAVLLIGSALSFDKAQDVSLWEGPGVPGAAVARLLLLLLALCLVVTALSDVGRASGATQLIASVLLLVSAVVVTQRTEPAAGSGATLIIVASIVSAAVGACVLFVSLGEDQRQPVDSHHVDPSVNN